MTALNQRLRPLRANGVPLRAKCAVTIKEQKPEFDANRTGRAPTPGSAPRRRAAGAAPPAPALGAPPAAGAAPRRRDRTGTALAGESAADFAAPDGPRPARRGRACRASTDPLRLTAGQRGRLLAPRSSLGAGVGVDVGRRRRVGPASLGQRTDSDRRRRRRRQRRRPPTGARLTAAAGSAGRSTGDQRAAPARRPRRSSGALAGATPAATAPRRGVRRRSAPRSPRARSRVTAAGRAAPTRGRRLRLRRAAAAAGSAIPGAVDGRAWCRERDAGARAAGDAAAGDRPTRPCRGWLGAAAVAGCRPAVRHAAPAAVPLLRLRGRSAEPCTSSERRRAGRASRASPGSRSARRRGAAGGARRRWDERRNAARQRLGGAGRARAAPAARGGLRWLTRRCSPPPRPVFKVDGTRAGRAGPRPRPARHRGDDRGAADADARTSSAARPRAGPSTDVVRVPRRAASSTSASGSRSRSARPATSGSSSPGAISALEVTFAEGDVPVVGRFAEDELMKLRMTQRSATYLSRSPTPTSPGRSPRARTDAAIEGRRADLRRRAAVQPERPRVPARAGAPDPGRAVGRPTARCTSRPATSGRAPRSR